MKPDREQLEADILAFVEGEMAPADAARMEVFLNNTDPQLAAQVRGMMDDRRTLRDTPQLKAPTDLAQRVLDSVERATLLDTSAEQQLGTEHRRWWRSHMALAAGLLLVLGVFGYFVADSVFSRGGDPWQSHGAGDSGKPTAAVVPAPAIAAPSVPAATLGMEAKDDRVASAVMSKTGGAGSLSEMREADRMQAPPSERKTLAQVALDQEVAKQRVDAARLGFGAESSVRTAFARSSVGPDARDPVILTLVAHSAADAARLRTRLGLWAAENARRGGGTGGAAPAIRMAEQAQANAKESTQPDELATRDTVRGLYQMPVDGAVTGPAAQAKGAADAMVQAKGAADVGVAKFEGPADAPFRVQLRADQIEALAGEFSVAALSRGGQSYVITAGEAERRNNEIAVSAGFANGPGNAAGVSNGGLNQGITNANGANLNNGTLGVVGGTTNVQAGGGNNFANGGAIGGNNLANNYNNESNMVGNSNGGFDAANNLRASNQAGGLGQNGNSAATSPAMKVAAAPVATATPAGARGGRGSGVGGGGGGGARDAAEVNKAIEGADAREVAAAARGSDDARGRQVVQGQQDEGVVRAQLQGRAVAQNSGQGIQQQAQQVNPAALSDQEGPQLVDCIITIVTPTDAR